MKKILVAILVLVLCVTALVACNPTGNNEGLERAKEYLDALYKAEPKITAADIERVPSLRVGEDTFTVTWTVEIIDGPQTVTIVPGDGKVIIDVEEATEDVVEDTNYKLTATITDKDGNTVSVTYLHTIPKFKVNTFADYVAAEDGAAILIDGVVTAILPNGNGATADGFFMNTLDGQGGVYVYGAYTKANGSEDIAIGKTVRVSGAKATYSGTYELTSATYNVINSTITTVEPVDFTAAYKAATDLKDAALTGPQALLVTVKGVKIGTVGGSKNDYYYFELDGKQSYVRLSSSQCPLTTAQQNAFKASFADHFGYTADVTGLVTLYSGSFYLTPVSENAFRNFQAPQLTDQQIVAGAKDALSIVDVIKEAGSVTLPTAGTGIYADATITWALAETTLATLEGNILNVAELPAEEGTITLTATIAKGDATPETKEFIITIKSAVIDWKTVAQGVELCEALDGSTNETSVEEYYFYGIVGEIYNTEYCNFYLVDEAGNSLIVYGLYAPNGTDRYGSKRQIAEIPFKTGDLICMRGNLQHYGEKLEIVNAVEVATPEKGTSIVNPMTVAEATDICTALDGSINETSEATYVIKGVVGEIYNTEYCNFYLVDDAEGSLIVYGLYAPNGTDRYGSKRQIAEIPFAQGDVMYLVGNLQHYGEKLEIVNAVLISYETVENGGETPDPNPGEGGGETPDPNPGEGGGETPDPNPGEGGETGTVHAGTEADPYSVTDALAVAGTLASNETYGTKVYITGVIKSIGSTGTYLKNVYIVDTENPATEILVYSVNFTTDVSAAYVNDTVTIFGYIKNYNGTLEVADGLVGSTKDYPTFTARTIGTSSITSTGANATVTLSATEGLNDSTFTFTVAAAAGYKVVSVKVNGTDVTDVDGTYTGTVVGPTVVAVETAQEGAPEAASLGKVTFSETTNSQKVSTYTTEWSATENGIKLNIANFNNNNNGWTYIKCGRKSDPSTAKIATGQMTQTVTKVVVTIDSVLDASKVTAFKLVVARDANFTDVVEEINGTMAAGEQAFSVSNPSAGLYYKLVFDCTAHGSKNGIVQVSGVEFFGYNA